MYIFLHVPKSAGTTLHHIIIDQHSARWSRSMAYQPGVWDPEAAAQNFLQMPRERQAAVEVFHGHVHYGVHKYLPAPSTYYTILRDPIERAISHYYYVLNNWILPDQIDGKPNNHPDRQRVLDGELTLEYYVSSGYAGEMDNGQTRLFAGESGLYERLPFGQTSEALLEEAKHNLRENVAVVGLTERFDESLLLIQRLCHWGTPFYVKQKVSQIRPKRKEISQSALDAIAERNQLDRQLYDYGVQLFEEQVARQGPGFAEDVRRFQELNRRYGRAVCRWNAFARTFRKGARFASDTLSRKTAKPTADFPT